MRDLLYPDTPPAPDPTQAARAAARPQLRARFYQKAGTVPEGQGGHAIALDGRPVRTPARRPLAAPSEALAEAIAAEWDAQEKQIDPARMPLTRLANTIIDGVADAIEPTAAEVVKYVGSDLLFYRAHDPQGLVTRQTAAWDPVLAWLRDAFGARFVLSEGVMFVAQPESSVAHVAAAIPADPWRLGAVHSITTLTGSALLAVAVLKGRLDAEQAWTAAHVDEDWNMEQWGRDELALQRRAFRRADMEAAATVLRLV